MGIFLLLKFSFMKLNVHLQQAYLTLPFVNDPAGTQNCKSHTDNQSELITLQTITPEVSWLTLEIICVEATGVSAVP